MKRIIILTITFISALLTTLHAQNEEDFEVTQNANNTLTITRYNGTVKDVVIPDTLYGLKVTIIGGSAFPNRGLTSVVIPDTVTTIQDGSTKTQSGDTSYSGAFSRNNTLTKVTLGSGLITIGINAFCSTNITEITIPDSVTTIKTRAFSGYTHMYQQRGKLTKINFGTGLQTVGENAFSHNQIEELNLPPSIKTMGYEAFATNAIKNVTFSTGLQTISRYLFRNNQIQELNLPSSIKTIEIGAFKNNKITSVVIPNGVTEIKNFHDVPYSQTWAGAFENNPITTVVIPPSLANGIIASYNAPTFGNKKNSTITKITIPQNMKEDILQGNFEESFVNFWKSQNRAGGTYVKTGPIWTKE